MAGITENGWAVLERPPRQFTPFRVAAAAEASLAGFGLGAKTTGLELATADTGDGPGRQRHRQEPERSRTRTTTAHVLSERLALGAAADRGAARQRHRRGDAADPRPDGAATCATGQPIVVTGERDDLPGVTVERGRDPRAGRARGGFTTLYFASPGLTFTVRPRDGHAERQRRAGDARRTVREVLGSGGRGPAQPALRPEQAAADVHARRRRRRRRELARGPGQRRAWAERRPALRARPDERELHRAPSPTTAQAG